MLTTNNIQSGRRNDGATRRFFQQYLCFWVFFIASAASIEGGEIAMKFDLVNMSEERQAQIVEDMLQNRRDLESNLVDVLSKKTSNQSACAAAFLLGECRLVGAIGILSKSITLAAQFSREQKRESLWGEFPAVEALVKIGSVAVPSMLTLIEGNKDAEVRKLAATVIFHIEGDEVAEFMLQKAVERQADAMKNEFLRIALQFVRDERRRVLSK